MALPYLKVENKQTIFSGKYMEVYIPSFYFEKKISKFIGTKIETYAIFTFRVFSTDKIEEVDKIREKTKLQSFNLPASIITCPTNYFIKNMDLLNTGDEDEIEKILVLQYYNGDSLIENNDVVIQLNDLFALFDLIDGGKIPNTISYDKLLELELKASEFHSKDLGVPATILETMLAESARNPKNSSEPFRFVINRNKDVDWKDYRLSNIRKLAAYNSTFTAMTFEDFDTSLVYALNKGIYNIKENISPIEATMKY